MFKNIIFLIILILVKQEPIRNDTLEEYKNNLSSSSFKFTKIEILLLILSVVVILVLFFICLSKILLIACKKYRSFEILMESYEKNELVKNNNILNHIKYIYGLKYIFLFLFQKIFKSVTYRKNKIKYLGNCTICLNDFNEKDKIYITSCEHTYHKKCMENYLELIKKELEKKERDIENFNSYFNCPNCKRFLFENEKLSIPNIINVQKNYNEDKNIIKNNNFINNNNVNNFVNNVNNSLNNVNKNGDSGNINNNINKGISDMKEIKVDNLSIKSSIISSKKMKYDTNSIDNISSNSLKQMKISSRNLGLRELKIKYGSKMRQDFKNNGFISICKVNENFSIKSLQEGDSNFQQDTIKLKKCGEIKNIKKSIRIIRNHNNNNLIQSVTSSSRGNLGYSLDILLKGKIKEDDIQ